MKWLFALFFCFSLTASEETYAILLAGGGGTRLWPASRDAFPKQFLDFGTGTSLLQKTVSRLLGLPDLKEIVISTNDQYEPLVRSQIEPYQDKVRISILVEPCRRNTAPAIALAAKYLSSAASPHANIIVAPADHLIEPEEEWVRSVASAFSAVQSGQIVTFGIQPTKPETGFGYLEIGAPFDSATYSLKRFIEKPNRAKAEELIQSPAVFWNAGIFAFTLETFWHEIALHAPEIYRLSNGTVLEMRERFSAMPDLSIDYAVMEKTSHIVASPLRLQWSDIGSWDGLYEVLPKDASGNVFQGNVVGLDAKNNLVFGKKQIALIGVEDLIVVETDDAILICKKGESQKIKTLLKKLEEK